MMRFNIGRASALVLGALLTWLGPVNAQTPEEFYKGKAVTLVVSAPAGTVSDFLGRQFAEYFAKHIPGQPDIIVQNVGGAGGMVAASQLQRTAAKDGTVIGFQQRNNLYRPLVENKHEQFDPREVQWIGSLNQETYCIVAWESSPVKTAAEAFEKEMILGATGFANENRTLPAMMNQYLGTKFNIVHGYSGREEVGLAMERGEAHGWLPTVDGLKSGQHADWIKSGKMKVIMVLDWKPHPLYPDVPTFADYVKDNAELKALIDFFILPFESGRPLAVPKEVPADRVAALRKAFDDTMTDPAFLEHMQKQDVPIDPITGQRIEEIVGALYAAPQSVLANVKEILTAKN